MKTRQVSVKINVPVELYVDAVRCAFDCNQSPERFMADIVESYVADRRLHKTVPFVDPKVLASKLAKLGNI